MITTNIERNMAISNLCKQILKSNEQIQFVGALNKRGKIVESELHDDRIISNMTKQESEMLFMQRTLQITLGMELDDAIGPLNSITLQRETLYEMIFPFSEGTIFVICSLEVIPRFLSKKISFILQDFEWSRKASLCQ